MAKAPRVSVKSWRAAAALQRLASALACRRSVAETQKTHSQGCHDPCWRAASISAPFDTLVLKAKAIPAHLIVPIRERMPSRPLNLPNKYCDTRPPVVFSMEPLRSSTVMPTIWANARTASGTAESREVGEMKMTICTHRLDHAHAWPTTNGRALPRPPGPGATLPLHFADVVARLHQD